ncbi:MAG TPA: methionine--tRNA ligase [Bacteroidia bacterium]|nr:methionine--tRNA ligase [Bacteroidia bacterium]
MNFKRTLVTAALPYANGPLHIGHIAGCYLPADIYVRYLRSKGEDVIFICGSDEHGVPITIRAQKEGTTPKAIVDKYHEILKNAFKGLNISFDIYSRTTSPVHYQTAQDFFRTLYNKNVFIEKETEQFYDPEANQFLADRYIIGTCPKCGFDKAYGDQCEKCGTSLSPEELINPKSALTNATPIKKKTKNWYLPLDKLQSKIANFIEQHKHWKPNVYGQCKSWLESSGGLQARAMTRDLNWGVPVPPEIPDSKGKVMYVWFDAPIGYISATKELLPDKWQLYWKSPETKLVHFIGKDNIVFHCIIFPAMLMEHGEYVLPYDVPANEFLNLEGDKISTSRNWAVWVDEYLVDFPQKADVLRYVLCATMPETKDNDFTWKEFQTRNNSELADILGNFLNRVIVLINKFYDGKIPNAGTFSKQDMLLINAISEAPQKIAEKIEVYKFRDALFELMQLARLGNKYLADNEPWKKIKSDPELVNTVMNLSAQIAANLAILSEPFMPDTSQKIFKALQLQPLKWANAGSIHLLNAGHIIQKESLILFEKIEDKVIEKQLEKLHQKKSEQQQQNPLISKFPLKTEINIEDFDKCDIRVGTVITAEKVQGTDKLMKLEVDLGFEKRTIVSGVAHCLSPDDLINKQVIVLANLKPRKIRGIESKGMILYAENVEGKLVPVSPHNSMPNGSVVK